jgi:hypothetical protein
LLILCLAGVFVLGLVPGQVALPGTVFVAIFAVVIAAFGVSQWRYAVVVGEASVKAGSFSPVLYQLSNASSISVRRVKGGRLGTVEFHGGAALVLNDGIERFDELLALISSRAALPVTKPVWDS